MGCHFSGSYISYIADGLVRQAATFNRLRTDAMLCTVMCTWAGGCVQIALLVPPGTTGRSDRHGYGVANGRNAWLDNGAVVGFARVADIPTSLVCMTAAFDTLQTDAMLCNVLRL